MRAWNSTLKPGKGLQRKSPLMATKPIARSRAPKMSANRKAPRTRGMKGATPTPDQRTYWDALAVHVGCIACHKDGVVNHVVSIHHIDGRTKPWAHWLVLPLCAGHHQDGTGAPGLIAVHPWKTRFEERYGSQFELLGLTSALAQEAGHNYIAQVLAALDARRRQGDLA